MVEQARQDKDTRLMVLSKGFNIKQNTSTAWLTYDDIDNLATFDIEDFRDWYYISGNDFAETTNLCANDILFFNHKTNEKFFLSHYLIPTEVKAKDFDRKLNPENKDYYDWEKQGLITIVEGNSVDPAIIADYHYELFELYNIKPYKIGYDNRFVKDFQNCIIQYFGEDILINIPQRPHVLNNPMRTLEADLKSKLVNI